MGVLFDLPIILFGHDCGAARERESVCPCKYVLRLGNTDGLSCLRKVKKKKSINRNSQRMRRGEGEALMSRWRRISVFHIEG